MAFEFYINVVHALVERAGVQGTLPIWHGASRGRSSRAKLHSMPTKRASRPQPPVRREKYKNKYLAATFSDTISIYLLSLYLDVDYFDCGNGIIPCWRFPALAEPSEGCGVVSANAGFEFAVLYKRR